MKKNSINKMGRTSNLYTKSLIFKSKNNVINMNLN